MHFATALPGEHGPVGGALCELALEFGNVLDIQEFGIGCSDTFRVVTTKTPKDVPGFLSPAGLGKPSGRLREEPDNAEQEQKGNNLERNWESPPDLAITAIDIREAAGNY